MEQRIRKEFRALLAPWLLALLLATTALWWRPGTDENAASVLWLACLSLGLVLLAVAAFGKEFSHGTIHALLGQPISRSRLWLEKAAALALAMVGVLLAFNVVVYHSLGAVNSLSGYLAQPVARIGLLVSVTAWSGGLCLTLLLRQMIAAFWIAILLPISLGLTLEYVGGKFFPTQGPGTWWMVALVVYSGVAGLGSWWLCLRYQDTQRLRDRTLYPFRFRLGGFGGRTQGSARTGNGTRAMIGKELHLQQINFICSLVLLLLFAPAFLPGTLWESNEWKRVAEILRLISWLVWALIPLLAGAVAISEERRLGLLEWQFSLPKSRLRQFLTKLSAAYLLSLFLGALVPWLLNGLVWSYATHKEGLLGDVGFEGSGLMFLAAFACLTTTLGLYASSLSKNLVESLTLAGVLLVATVVATALIQFTLVRYSPSPLLLGGWLAVPTLFVLLLILSFRNCMKPVTGFRSFLSDAPIVGITIVVVCATTLGLWARVWELALPAPSRPDTPPISGNISPEIVLRPNRLQVLLPDGRMWERGTWWNATRTEPPGAGGSSRWMALASTPGTDVAIKVDGTLWAWGGWPLEGGKSIAYQGEPIQVGKESDWKSVACGSRHAVVLKKDGSLWAWGANNYGQLGDGTKTNRAAPVRIGHDDDWTAVAGGGDYSLAVKKDGTLWHWGLFTSLLGYKIERASLMWSSPARIGTGTNWTSVFCAEYFAMASQNDGSLWAWRQVLDAQTGTYDLAREPVRVGGASRWKTVAPSFGGTTGISPDGILWMWATADTWRPWRFRRSSGTQRDDVIRLSERSNWVATAIAGETVLALSADGCLWEWGNPLDERPGKRRFLCYSRRPRLIADLGTAKGN